MNQYNIQNDIFNPDYYSCYTDYLRQMTKYFNLDNPAPFISARSWVMMNLKTHELMYAKMEKKTRQVASLTKIMTAYVIINLLDKYNLDPH